MRGLRNKTSVVLVDFDKMTVSNLVSVGVEGRNTSRRAAEGIDPSGELAETDFMRHKSTEVGLQPKLGIRHGSNGEEQFTSGESARFVGCHALHVSLMPACGDAWPTIQIEPAHEALN